MEAWTADSGRARAVGSARAVGDWYVDCNLVALAVRPAKYDLPGSRPGAEEKTAKSARAKVRRARSEAKASDRRIGEGIIGGKVVQADRDPVQAAVQYGPTYSTMVPDMSLSLDAVRKLQYDFESVRRTRPWLASTRCRHTITRRCCLKCRYYHAWCRCTRTLDLRLTSSLRVAWPRPTVTWPHMSGY